MATTILVADDEHGLRVAVRMRLEHVGYVVLEAENGAEAVIIAKKELPDGILMDIRMPVMDGLEALREIAADEATAGIPVGMVSASMRDQATAIGAGAAFFLPKPYRHLELITAVESMLKSKN